MAADAATALVLRGRNIRFDENGLACLNDIWSAAGFTKSQRPKDWLGLSVTSPKIQRVIELVTGKSRDYTPEDTRRAYRTWHGSTYADIRLALDYAEYLNPKLAIEVKEVFLRYKAGDVTLADEVMERANAEANEWMAKRSLSRAARLGYTATLKDHGVREPSHYAECTNETYRGIFGKTAAQLKKEKDTKGKPLRDAFDLRELATVAFAEVMSTDRIEEEACRGFVECRNATTKVASAVGAMIENEKKDRQKRLV